MLPASIEIESGSALKPFILRVDEVCRTGERSTPVPFPPPLAPAKAFSRSGSGQIFPLFSRVMRERLSTGSNARKLGSGLSGPMFSGPDDYADSVNLTHPPVFQPFLFNLSEWFHTEAAGGVTGTALARSGMTMRNTAPPVWGLFGCASIFPPWAPTRSEAIASPSPEPILLVVT